MLIKYPRSIILACDVSSLSMLEKLVMGTCRGILEIGGYKVGFELVIPYGLKTVVEKIREYTTDLLIIYDHQKGGTDIPELGEKFAASVADSGANAVILFPFGGRKTEIEWINACRDNGLEVLVGGHMTQQEFLSSQGGFINDDAVEKIFVIAAEQGVRDFVIPGNQPKFVLKYRKLLEKICGKDNFALYAPGFIAQGGEISKISKIAGKNFHAIVGRELYENDDVEKIQKAAKKLVSYLVS